MPSVAGAPRSQLISTASEPASVAPQTVILQKCSLRHCLHRLAKCRTRLARLPLRTTTLPSRPLQEREKESAPTTVPLGRFEPRSSRERDARRRLLIPASMQHDRRRQPKRNSRATHWTTLPNNLGLLRVNVDNSVAAALTAVAPSSRPGPLAKGFAWICFFRFSFDLCVFRPTRSPWHPKRAPWPHPSRADKRSQQKASDLDI